MTRVNIRRAVPADVFGIHRLIYNLRLVTFPNRKHRITRHDLKEGFREDGWFSKQLVERRQLLKRKSYIAFVAEQGGQIVGFISISLLTDTNIVGLFYAIKGRGLGGRLWRTAEEVFDPLKPVALFVVEYNKNAIAIYEHYGLRKTGVRRGDVVRKRPRRVCPMIEMVRPPALQPR